jgi:hypothetical protein
VAVTARGSLEGRGRGARRTAGRGGEVGGGALGGLRGAGVKAVITGVVVGGLLLMSLYVYVCVREYVCMCNSMCWLDLFLKHLKERGL